MPEGHLPCLVERRLAVLGAARGHDPLDDRAGLLEVVGADALDAQRWPSVDSSGSTDGRSAVGCEASFEGSTNR